MTDSEDLYIEITFKTSLAFKILLNFFLLGKILGISGNYIIAEVEFRDGEDPHQDVNDDKNNAETPEIVS